MGLSDELDQILHKEVDAATKAREEVRALFKQQEEKRALEVNQLRRHMAKLETSNKELKDTLAQAQTQLEQARSSGLEPRGSSSEKRDDNGEPPKKARRVLLFDDKEQLVDAYTSLRQKLIDTRRMGHQVHEKVIMPVAEMAEMEEDDIRELEEENSKMGQAKRRAIDGWLELAESYGDAIEGENPWGAFKVPSPAK